MLKYLSLAKIGFVTGIANLSVAFCGIFLFSKVIRKKNIYTTISLLCLALLSSGILYADSWIFSSEQEVYQDPIIFSKTSAYQRIILTKRNDRVRLYLNGQLQFSSEDEEIYHEYLVHLPMSLARKREKVLILGGGDGLALREVLKYSNVISVTLVDIDPGITKMASSNPEMLKLNRASLLAGRVKLAIPDGVAGDKKELLVQPSEKVRAYFKEKKITTAEVYIRNIDADKFLDNIKEKFDVVIIDFPDPSTLEIAKLYSKEFYIKLNDKVNDNGIISVQSSSPYFANQVFLCIGKTLSASGFYVMPYHDNVPSFGEWGWYLGWKGDLESEIMDKIVNMKSLEVKTGYLNSDLIKTSLIFPEKWLNKYDKIKISSKMNPVLLSYYNNSWKL